MNKEFTEKEENYFNDKEKKARKLNDLHSTRNSANGYQKIMRIGQNEK